VSSQSYRNAYANFGNRSVGATGIFVLFGLRARQKRDAARYKHLGQPEPCLSGLI
jgi:hypothetical protein